MRTVKIDERQQKGVYKVTCSCGLNYIGETGRSLKVRMKEHDADIRNQRIRTSALAEHSEKTNTICALKKPWCLLEKTTITKGVSEKPLK